MERMIKDFNIGECYIYANTRDEYSSFVDWLMSKGWKFCYHFETGEGYQIEKENGWVRVVEVYGFTA